MSFRNCFLGCPRSESHFRSNTLDLTLANRHTLILAYQASVLRDFLTDPCVQQRLKATLKDVADGAVPHGYEAMNHLMQHMFNRCCRPNTGSGYYSGSCDRHSASWEV